MPKNSSSLNNKWSQDIHSQCWRLGLISWSGIEVGLIVSYRMSQLICQLKSKFKKWLRLTPFVIWRINQSKFFRSIKQAKFSSKTPRESSPKKLKNWCWTKTINKRISQPLASQVQAKAPKWTYLWNWSLLNNPWDLSSGWTSTRITLCCCIMCTGRMPERTAQERNTFSTAN